jgi:hypothetical protein
MTGSPDTLTEIRTRSMLDGLEAEDEFIASASRAFAAEPDDDPVAAHDADTDNECRELLHSEHSAGHRASDIIGHAARAAGDQPRDVVAELDADAPYFDRRPRDGRAVTEVKHVDKDALFNVQCLPDRVRMLLASFLGRWKRNKWMRDQWMYVQEASLAAGYAAVGYGGKVGLNQYRYSTNISAFDGHAFLNCGSRVKTKTGGSVFIRCHQKCQCRSCSRWERLEPSKDEFLVRFHRGVAWYGITIVGVSDPRKAGVKMRVGYRDDGTPIDRWLSRLPNVRELEKLPKFGLDHDWDMALSVAEATYRVANYLTNNRHFKGLHAVPETSFRFFPDDHVIGGVGHTVNNHIHGYGNTSRVFDEKRGLQILHGAVNCFDRAGALGYAYPDILLSPALTVGAMETAMNYAIKSQNFAESYVQALANGCPIIGLNHLFHQTVFGAEQMSPGGSMGEKFGNMSMKSGKYYIGRPPLAKMSPAQLERYWQKHAADDLWDWEIERHDRHLEFMARQRKRNGKPVPEHL